MQKVLEDSGCSDTAGKAEIRQPLPNDEDYEEGLRCLSQGHVTFHRQRASVLQCWWPSGVPEVVLGAPPAWRCLIPHNPSWDPGPYVFEKASAISCLYVLWKSLPVLRTRNILCSYAQGKPRENVRIRDKAGIPVTNQLWMENWGLDGLDHLVSEKASEESPYSLLGTATYMLCMQPFALALGEATQRDRQDLEWMASLQVPFPAQELAMLPKNWICEMIMSLK